MNGSEAFNIKAKHKLRSSKILYEFGQYEDSVDRLYYAIFLSIKALLVKKGYKINSYKSLNRIFHSIYVDNNDFDNNIAKYLPEIHSLKNKVNYISSVNISKELANKKIKQAEKFMTEAEKFLK